LPDDRTLERGFAHDAAKRALSQARLDAIANSIPEDICNRRITEARDRSEQEESRQWLKHPFRMIGECVWLLVMGLGFALSQPRRRQPHDPPPPPQTGCDMVRGAIVRTWLNTLHFAVRSADSQLVVLDRHLFPPLSSEEAAQYHYTSWVDHIPLVGGMLASRDALLELVDIFAAHVKAAIDTDGPLEFPAELIRVRKEGDQYVAERITSRAA